VQVSHDVAVAGAASAARVGPNRPPKQRPPSPSDVRHRAHDVGTPDAVHAPQRSYQAVAAARGVCAGRAHDERAIDDVQERKVGDVWNETAHDALHRASASARDVKKHGRRCSM